MLLQVAQGLSGVPRKHIRVYTLIPEECKWGAPVVGGRCADGIVNRT
jgi:hypothetical protein